MGLKLSYGVVAKKVCLVFRCVEIGDTWYLAKDTSVLCFTDTWVLHNFISFGGLILFIVGVPTLFVFTLQSARKVRGRVRMCVCPCGRGADGWGHLVSQLSLLHTNTHISCLLPPGCRSTCLAS